MTPFMAIPSLFQCVAINQDGGNFSNFKVLQKKEELTKNKNVFAEVLKLNCMIKSLIQKQKKG